LVGGWGVENEGSKDWRLKAMKKRLGKSGVKRIQKRNGYMVVHPHEQEEKSEAKSKGRGKILSCGRVD